MDSRSSLSTDTQTHDTRRQTRAYCFHPFQVPACCQLHLPVHDQTTVTAELQNIAVSVCTAEHCLAVVDPFNKIGQWNLSYLRHWIVEQTQPLKVLQAEQRLKVCQFFEFVSGEHHRDYIWDGLETIMRNPADAVIHQEQHLQP